MIGNEAAPSKYKQKFLDKYSEMINEIRFHHFKDYNGINKNENLFSIFKAGLLDNILSHFNKIWDCIDTDEHLHVLEVLKTDPRNDSVKKWRPTGKSAEEQVRPLVVNKLKWQIKYYKKQIQFQKQQLENAVARIETGRKRLAEAKIEREAVVAAVTSELRDFKRIEAQITDIDEKINNDLQQ
ncbi:uncharacterized protein LOC129726099 isoform X2 [Wyeomyia smithii]|nr:uncharacterized protein LOC129726099 isoform X2 [Wyeomyia smithii]XP_055538713.1 uncharacterized protein LOC129726099 isoform X2 [Wyeomyia smithii]